MNKINKVYIETQKDGKVVASVGVWISPEETDKMKKSQWNQFEINGDKTYINGEELNNQRQE